MKQNIKKRWLSAAFIILLALIIPLCFLCSGDKMQAHAASVDTNYYFKNIQVDITVNRDKTYDITETLKTQFLESGINTGIIRDIQRESATTRIIDGVPIKGRKYLSGLDNVSVTLDGGEAKVTRSLYGSFHSVKMQKPDGGYLSAGEHVFVLKYTYDMSDDKINGFDDFTFDVLGYSMAFTGVFEAKITFPEGTDLSDVSFRTNDKAEWEPDKSYFETTRVKDNEIYMRALPKAAQKGYTVQVILPDGYFDCGLTFYWYYVLFFVLALLGIAACAVIIVAGTLNKKVLDHVEYMPPDDVDIMHI